MFRSTSANHIRLMVIGEEGVGKSALVVKYLTGRFIWEYQSDFDWKYAYQTNIDGEQVHMEIIDSLNMDESHIRWAEGFMFVYDITNPESVQKIEQFQKRLESVRSSRNFSMVVVGNKADLEHCREVNREKIECLVSRLSILCHVDCSACGPEMSVRFAFDELCREVAHLRMRSAQKRERRRSSLSQVRQGLKMLVQTGKTKNHPISTPNSGNNSPVGVSNGKSTSNNNSRRGSRFVPSSPYSSLMSAPILNDLPEESNCFFDIFSDDSDKKSRKSRESSTDSFEEMAKRPSSHHHQKNMIGALVL
ncbi:ras-related and estrogen-regulated growth inhibitor-like [Clavelina lepadiformis]|uniref:small monomeric GTPase n=1 Tax=Clavelina lepadiformis TaxID=159417 RepID=A0ABP0GKN5_CLALP